MPARKDLIGYADTQPDPKWPGHEGVSITHRLAMRNIGNAPTPPIEINTPVELT